MSQEKMRFLSYICPSCRQSVIVQRSVFSLAAAPTEITCPCGKSHVSVEFLSDRVHLEVPCLFCGRGHTVSCSSKAFLEERALAFSCAASRLDCCYVGEKELVYSATRRLEQAADKLEGETEQRGTFLDELVMHEILSELKEIGQRDGISCTCGSKDWRMKVGYSAVEISCCDCGAQTRIAAAASEDIADLCCSYTLKIGRSGGR